MNFEELRQLITEDYVNPSERVSLYTLEKISMLIQTALINNKQTYYRLLETLDKEADAMVIMEELKKVQPIPGYHSFPLSATDAALATRLRVERDNFQEQRWTKKK